MEGCQRLDVTTGIYWAIGAYVSGRGLQWGDKGVKKPEYKSDFRKMFLDNSYETIFCYHKRCSSRMTVCRLEKGYVRLFSDFSHPTEYGTPVNGVVPLAFRGGRTKDGVGAWP